MSDVEAMEIQRTLGRMESKLDSLASAVASQNKRGDVHAHRITVLETWRTRSTAFFAGVTFVISLLGAGVYHLLFLAKN